jgi:hypothetical protein
MGYIHIENLDTPKGRRLLLFKEVYALEKVFGTSARIDWRDGTVFFSSGGSDAVLFKEFFNEEQLKDGFRKLGHPRISINGEAYGGKEQGQSGRYGNELRFIVFDIKIGDLWLAVPNMQQVSDSLGLETVPWTKISTDIDKLRELRDAPSEVAVRRGVPKAVDREGVVLRPLIELKANDGERLIAKFKGKMFSERKTWKDDPTAVSPVLVKADSVAEEWVTEMRLTHVLQHIQATGTIAGLRSDGGIVGSAVLEDVRREAGGEIVWNKETERAVKRKGAQLFLNRLASKPEGKAQCESPKSK